MTFAFLDLKKKLGSLSLREKVNYTDIQRHNYNLIQAANTGTNYLYKLRFHSL